MSDNNDIKEIIQKAIDEGKLKVTSSLSDLTDIVLKELNFSLAERLSYQSFIHIDDICKRIEVIAKGFINNLINHRGSQNGNTSEFLDRALIDVKELISAYENEAKTHNCPECEAEKTKH